MLALIIVGVIAVGLAGASVFMAVQNARLRAHVAGAQTACHALQSARAQLQTRVAEVEAEDQRKADWLDHHEKELEWLREELEKRPKITRKTYKVLTVGVSGTGKTALTLKWANPLVDLGTLQGTKIERYERTVSHVTGQGVTIEHTFEIGDWGGEHIVEAQHELLLEEVHGLLIVVDLARKDTRALDPERIEQQLGEFQPQALKYFFGPRTLASCKTVVLFINKSDVLSGTPTDIENEARSYYKRLIDNLDAYKSDLDVRVLVGSAQSGHSTHHLFAHFVERILPKNAYDNQLLQQMKGDTSPPEGSSRGSKLPGPEPVTLPLPPPLPPLPPRGAVRPPAMVSAPAPVPERSAHVVRK